MGRRAAARCTCSILTNGDRGSADPGMDRGDARRTRCRETEAAGEVMGLAGARILGMHDGELQNTQAIREAVVAAIREVRAETVAVLRPHRVVLREHVLQPLRPPGAPARSRWTRSFPGAGNPHFFSEHLAEGLELAAVHDVWLGWTNEPNHREDVSDHFRTRSTRSRRTRASSRRASRSSRSSCSGTRARRGSGSASSSPSRSGSSTSRTDLGPAR